MKTGKYLGFVLIAIAGGLISLFAYTHFFERKSYTVSAEQYPARLTQLSSNDDTNRVDFTYAAEKSIHAVVHVKTISMQNRYGGEESVLDFFFGYRNQRPQPVAGFGSGVIISNDGYIVTNNHVIDNAEEIQVTLNDNRTYEKVKLVGRDPDTDLAVLKIDEKDLPFISYGNSDALRVGEWVLAVGNPYNLTSTVTAGIVSAKARSLNLLGGRGGAAPRNSGIESFIQTDAAVNPGNSGGALVNTNGELVGINTAIASPTGSYIGNSFAVPVTIVRKVVGDLIEFGKVQRALLGITIKDINSELAKTKNIEIQQGVYVEGLTEDGAAKGAGIQEGDIIVSINGQPTNSVSQLQEQVSRYRPNDKVEVLLLRDNKKKQILVTLRNMEGTTKIVTKDEVISVLGAQLAEVKPSDRSKLGIRNGVQVVEIGPGKLRSEGVQKGYIILSINNQSVNTVDDVKRILGEIKGGVYVEGVYPNGVVAYYAFGI